MVHGCHLFSFVFIYFRVTNDNHTTFFNYSYFIDYDTRHVEDFCLWDLTKKWVVHMFWEARWLKIQGVDEKMQLV